MALNGTPGGALQAMQQGSQAPAQGGQGGAMGQGFDPNQDPFNLAGVGQMAGQQQQQMNQMPQETQTPDIPHPDQQHPSQKLRGFIEEVNIAEHLSEEKLRKIGMDCAEGFEVDLMSREVWEHKIEDYTKLALQIQEQKAYPWPKASNVKYPLLSTAAMQFAARAYPTLVPSDGHVVLGQVIGKDPDDSKQDQAERISTYMSYDIMHQMEGWEEDMDKLLIMLPIVGTMFKKTFWNPIKKKNCSHLLLPKNVVVNYWATNMCDAERISEMVPMTKRILKQKQMSKLFLDVDLGAPPSIPFEFHPKMTNWMPANDDTTPYEIVEQHCYIDLDDDDYAEPYIVTFHRQSRKVLRIAARYDESTILFNDDGTLAGIEPIHYYTKFGFIPSPDGSFYDIGFGMLLGPLNESVNTLINQLVDAGTLNNLQAGFIGKGLRLRMGDMRFMPGQWQAVNAVGDDLKKQIFPLPTKEPSPVLFQLMGTLITSGKELASVAEIFTGKMPGQNTPATTTMATVEQGMKVFTAIYKRIYRALAEEFCKLFKLNATYLDPQTYSAVINEPIGPDDFDETTYRVIPAADPNAVSQQEKLQKAESLLQLLPIGVLDPVAVIKRVLQAQEQPNYEQLLNQAVQQTGQMPPPPPDPKVQELQMKQQAQQQDAQLKMAMGQQQMELDGRNAQQKMAMQQQEHQQKMQMTAQEAQMNAAAQAHQVQAQIQGENLKMQHQQQMNHQELQMQQENHKATMQQTQETHKANLKNTAEVSKSKAAAARHAPSKTAGSAKK
jgi:chaperonin GroES